MKMTLTISKDNRQINFSDLDKDEEMEIMIDFGDDEERFFWLDKDNLFSLRKHIDNILKTP